MSMDIIIGILLTLNIEIIVIFGYNLYKKRKPNVRVSDKQESSEEEHRIKMMQQGFHNVIKDYDIDVAMGRREQR